MLHLGRYEEARDLLRTTLGLSRQVGLTEITGETVVALAAVEFACGEAASAARLLGAAETVFEESQEHLGFLEAQLRLDTIEGARSALSEDDFAEAWKSGRSATRAEAMELATSAAARARRA